MEPIRGNPERYAAGGVIAEIAKVEDSIAFLQSEIAEREKKDSTVQIQEQLKALRGLLEGEETKFEQLRSK